VLYLTSMAHPKKTTSRSPRSRMGDRVRLGPSGRLVIPPALRREMGIKAGEELFASVEGGALVLRSRRRALEELQARWEAVEPGHPGELLSDELIRERREEAAREALE
jgi:antitoxin component of MazEF toxin-antitoxin module